MTAFGFVYENGGGRMREGGSGPIIFVYYPNLGGKKEIL